MTPFEASIGKTKVHQETIDSRRAEMLAATLGKPTPKNGEVLPNLWHWAWFNEALPASELGRDGHPKRGGFIPDIPLPRRMWAGGELTFIEPIIVGQQTEKQSTIEAIKSRDGSSGKLCILTIAHTLSQNGTVCLEEKQNLVFREDPSPDAAPPQLIMPPHDAEHSEILTPDPVLMFRYSALTFNGHRIHYDVDYAREVEGYPDLVFHAPLTATYLFQSAANILGDTPARTFSYRATAALFCNATIRLNAKWEATGITAWAETPDGHQAMIASMNS